VYRPVDAIEVRIWGKTAGAVALDPKLGYYAFEYAPASVRSGVEIALLTLPLSEAQRPFVFTTTISSFW
jgi:serine/threonine-protein kinase HipA